MENSVFIQFIAGFVVSIAFAISLMLLNDHYLLVDLLVLLVG